MIRFKVLLFVVAAALGRAVNLLCSPSSAVFGAKMKWKGAEERKCALRLWKALGDLGVVLGDFGDFGTLFRCLK